MIITPDTDIRLLKMPLTIDYNNQLTFVSLDSQLNYFYGLPNLQLDDATYLRKDGVIRFNRSFDEIIGYNYVMYKNESYGDKWFFAFITGMQYKANKTTDIYIQTDVYQTWQFEMDFKPSFVEREMINTNDDVPRCFSYRRRTRNSVNINLHNIHIMAIY